MEASHQMRDPKDELTETIIGSAIEVHRHLGPGLLESVYRRCLLHELRLRGLAAVSEVGLDLVYKGLVVPNAYRMDLVVADLVVLEVKAVEQLHDVHKQQLLTYLRLSGRRIGLLLNFRARLLRDGLVRLVL